MSGSGGVVPAPQGIEGLTAAMKVNIIPDQEYLLQVLFDNVALKTKLKVYHSVAKSRGKFTYKSTKIT